MRVEPTTAPADDASLVRQVQSGESRAFEALVVRYQDRVFNMCWRMCGNVEDARDLTQETFLKAFKGIGSFTGSSGFYTWVFRIGMNLALSHRRKARLRLVGSLDSADRDGAPLTDRVVDHRAGRPSVETDELRRRVSRALDEIEAEHRSAAVLRDVEGFDYRQIAEILDVPVGTVKSRVHRARMALREAMERCGSEKATRE